MAEVFKNYIDGKWVGSKSGETFENRNPADWREVVGIFPRSTKEEVEKAVKAARKAYPEWARMPAPKRGEIMRRAGELMTERKDEIAQLMTREMGKVLKETLGAHTYEKYLTARRIEWDDYRIQVTKWEVDKYLQIL